MLLELKYIYMNYQFYYIWKNIFSAFPIRYIIIYLLLPVVLSLSACKEHKAKGEYNDPYSKEEVERMMAYHGSLTAKFDGKQWWCLSGKTWFKIENGGASRVVNLSANK